MIGVMYVAKVNLLTRTWTAWEVNSGNALVDTWQASTAPTTCGGVHIFNCGRRPVYVQLFDRETLPTRGQVPVRYWQIDARSADKHEFPSIYLARGLVLVASVQPYKYQPSRRVHALMLAYQK